MCRYHKKYITFIFFNFGQYSENGIFIDFGSYFVPAVRAMNPSGFIWCFFHVYLVDCYIIAALNVRIMMVSSCLTVLATEECTFFRNRVEDQDIFDIISNL